MIGKVGYACINESLKPSKFKSIRLATVHKKGIEALQQIILHNLKFLEEILIWNVAHDLLFYRVPSDLMPLVTHPEVLDGYEWRWYGDPQVINCLEAVADYVRAKGLRLSMHPDQFTVLNSHKPVVVDNAVINLAYHTRLLKALGGKELILHVGGVYDDKESAIERFVYEFNQLDEEIKLMIRLENDDKSYDIYDVLDIAAEIGVPVVFDLHHHRCHGYTPVSRELLDRIEGTWRFMTPKIHISSGRDYETHRSHHDYISSRDCKMIWELYRGRRVDVMVEAKKKEQAALGLLSFLNKSSLNEIYRTA